MQLELPIRNGTAHDVQADCAALALWLRGRGWRKADAITEVFNWHDRYVRKIASESGGRIISGQQGYKLTLEATPDEIRHATQWLRSQARMMIGRSLRIARVWHEAAGGKGVVS